MSDVKDRMMAEERVQIAYNEAWQLAFDLADEHESAFRAGWNAALTDARIVAAKDEEIRRLRDALERLEWKPITPDNLPKLGDEIHGPDSAVLLVFAVDEGCLSYSFATWKQYGWTHFRTLNPPQQKEGQ